MGRPESVRLPQIRLTVVADDAGEIADRIGGGPADAEIGESVFDHDLRIEEIAAVDDDGIAEGLVEAAEIERGELRPVGQDEQGVGIVCGRVGVARHSGELRAGGKNLLGALHGCGIVGGDGAAFGEEHLDEFDRGRFADVVGLALEGKAKDAEALAAQGPEGGAHLGEEALLLLDVDLFDFGEEVEVDAKLLGDGAEGGYVLGEAGAAVTDAGTEESRADAAVEAHAAGYLLDVGVGGFAEIGDGVDEGDLQGEKGVGGVLDDLRALGGGKQQGRGLATLQVPAMASGLLVVFAAGERGVDGD